MPFIRELRPDDSGLLEEFLSSLSPRTIRFFSFHPLPKGFPENFVQRGDITCFVADLGGKIVGIVWWEPSFAPIPALAICVQDAYQGNGIGKKLLNRLIREARSGGKKGLRLTVSKNNKIAISLYKKAGFKIIGEYRDSKGLNYVMELLFC